MADEITPLPEPAALALVTAAAGAAGACPLGQEQAWSTRVTELAVGMYRLVDTVSERVGLLCASKWITGVITGVEERSGRAHITIRPTMGNSTDPEPPLRTPWLSEPRGRAMCDQARALMGHHCRFAKWTDSFADGGKTKKACMLEWIEDLGADPAAPAAPAARHAAPASAPAATPGPDAPPVAEGYVALRAMRPTTLAELWNLADTHLNIDAATVDATAKRKWGRGDVTVVTADLKPNQLLILWNQLVNDFGRVAAA